MNTRRLARRLARRCAPLLLASLLACASLAHAQGTGATPADLDAQAEKVLLLQGKEFPEALRKLYLGYTRASPSLPMLRRLLERLEAERAAAPTLAQPSLASNNELWFSELSLVRLFGQVGEAQDYARLLQIYDLLSIDSRLHSAFFDALSEMWIRREMAGLLKARPKVAPHPSAEPLPANLQAAAPPLIEAWRSYKGAVAPFNARFVPWAPRPQAQAAIEVQQSWPAFYKVIGDFFHGRSEGIVEKIAAFEWGGGCGTGSEQFSEPRDRTLFMALWGQKRYELALGALLARADASSSYLSSRKNEWPRDFITACGLDWQTLYAGAVLDGGWRTGEMAAQGSQTSARLLELMGALPFVAAREDYLKAIAAFITPAPFASGAMPEMVAGLRLTSKPPMAPEMQERLLQILHAQMRPEAGLETLGAVSGLLGELRRSESVDVLQRALKLPYSRVRQNALEALQEMGHKVEAPQTPSKVGFRVLLDGRPLQSTPLNWSMKASGLGGWSSSGAQTDADGVLQLERDYLEDTQRKVSEVTFTSPTLKKPEDAWIEASTPAPANLDARTDIAIATQSLSLRVAPFAAGAKMMSVRLKGERHQTWGTTFEAISEWMPLPTNRAATFAHLQRGRYQLEVRAPGFAQWRSQELALGEQPVAIEATLQKGADVHFELLAPGGESRDRSPDYTLQRDDAPRDSVPFYDHYDYLTQTYYGLPVGSYTLKIKPSRERQNRRATTTATPYEGQQRAFAIDAASPPLIELGEIALQEAAAPAVPETPRAIDNEAPRLTGRF